MANAASNAVRAASGSGAVLGSIILSELIKLLMCPPGQWAGLGTYARRFSENHRDVLPHANVCRPCQEHGSSVAAMM